MTRKPALILSLAALPILSAHAGDHDPRVIAPLLKDAKISLVEGIERAEKQSGPATSAKFEVEDGKLMLSVYTVPEGLGVEPEKATLTELSALASANPVELKAEVFADKEHIARASVHMTLLQQSRLTLKQVIARALQIEPGTPIDVRNPQIRNHQPVADVVIIDDDDHDAETVTVNLLTGKGTLNRR